MLKSIKIILLVLLLGFTSLNFGSRTEASSQNVNEEKKEIVNVDDALLNLGYPERLVNELSQFEKEDIVNQGNIAEFVGATTTYIGFDGEVTLVDDYSSEDMPVVPFGTINSMTVTQVVSRLVNADKVERFEIRGTHQWTISPVNRRTDYLGFALDGNKFNYVPGTSVVSVGPDGPDSKATYTSTNLYQSSFTGIGFSFPLPSSGTRPVVMTKAQIQEVSAGSGSSQLHSTYMHTKAATGTIGLNLGILTVSFLCSIDNDQRATVVDFKY